MRPALRVALLAVLLVAIWATRVAAQDQPNIVVVMVDDLSVSEYEAALSNNVWPSIRQLVEAGTKFTEAYASTSLCGPSRATFLTGQHSHNHGLKDNLLPAGGVTKLDDTATLPVWLRSAGYRTGLVGKYLNGYGANNTGSPKDDPTYIPPGWNDWPVRRVLGDQIDVRLTVRRRRRGEHDPLDPVGSHRVEQVERADDVAAVVALRELDGLGDQRQRREVHDAVESRHRGVDRLDVEQVDLQELGTGGNGGAMAAIERVEHGDLVAARQQAAGRRSSRCSRHRR